MCCDFHITMSRYGPTLHLTPVGELDFEAGPAFELIRAALAADTTLVACDMRHVRFMDVTGLNCLLALGHLAEARGAVMFVYNWRRQPLRLLDLVDDLGRKEAGLPADSRSALSRVLRRTLAERADAGRAVGVGRVRDGRASTRSADAASRSRRPGTFPQKTAAGVARHQPDVSPTRTAPRAALLPAARRPEWPDP